MSKILKGNQLIVEYRFYGKSRPNPTPWEYLKNDQAIADYHSIVTKLKTPKNIPSVVLMDVNMPIMNGIETTEYLKKNYPDIKVIALSVEEEEDTIIKMLKAGAKGYLLKDVEKSILEASTAVSKASRP